MTSANPSRRAASGSAPRSIAVTIEGSGRCGSPSRSRWPANDGPVATATSCPASRTASATGATIGAKCEYTGPLVNKTRILELLCLLMLASFMSDDLVWSGSKCQSTPRGGRVPCLRRE